MKRKTVRILLLEEDPNLRERIRATLNREPDVFVVREGNGTEVKKWVEENRGDLLLTSSLTAVAEFAELNARLRIILISEMHFPRHLTMAINLGVCGYVVMDQVGDTLCRAIRCVSDGESYVDPRVTAAFFTEFRRVCSQTPLQVRVEEKAGFLLTPREKEVLRLIAEGKSNRAISQVLFISEKTAKNHVSSILQKLNVEDRTHAVVLSIKNGWLHV